MVALEAHLNRLNFSTEVITLNNLIKGAHTATTFWGSRVVEVDGYEGSLYLDDLAQKILEVGHQRSDREDLSTQERVAGIDIVKKLKNFYITTDKQIENSNCLTRILNWLREFSLIPYTTRFYVERSAHFRAYSKEKFLEQFGGSFNEFGEHPLSDGCFGPPYRIAAREDSIRRLLTPV